MSFLTAFVVREHRAAVTIAWPEGAPMERATAGHPGEHNRFGIAAGARVQTGRGAVPASHLVPGDVVFDGRGGCAPLVAALDVAAELGTERVEIRAGALGGGLPVSDLVLGRGTRLVVRSDLALRLVGRRDVLIPAEALLHLDGVSLVPANLTESIHLVFDEHAIAAVAGVQVEGLVPCAAFIESLPHRQMEALRAALPKLRYDGAFAAYATEMPELDDREARQVLTAPASFGGERPQNDHPPPLPDRLAISTPRTTAFRSIAAI